MRKSCSYCGLRQVWVKAPHGIVVESYVYVDACIAPLVRALNVAGIMTTESCCGHGKENGVVFLQDGRILRIQSPTGMREVLS